MFRLDLEVIGSTHLRLHWTHVVTPSAMSCSMTPGGWLMISAWCPQSSLVCCSGMLNPSGCASEKPLLALGALHTRGASKPFSIHPLVGLGRAEAHIVSIVIVFRWGERCLLRRWKVVDNFVYHPSVNQICLRHIWGAAEAILRALLLMLSCEVMIIDSMSKWAMSILPRINSIIWICAFASLARPLHRATPYVNFSSLSTDNNLGNCCNVNNKSVSTSNSCGAVWKSEYIHSGLC